MSENSTTNVPETMSFPENEILEKTVVNDHVTIIKKVVSLYMCNYCGKEMSTLGEIKLHGYKVHSLPFKCPFCKKYMAKESYLKHFKKFHKNGENFQCKCGKVLASEENLNHHQVKCSSK